MIELKMILAYFTHFRVEPKNAFDEKGRKVFMEKKMGSFEIS